MTEYISHFHSRFFYFFNLRLPSLTSIRYANGCTHINIKLNLLYINNFLFSVKHILGFDDKHTWSNMGSMNKKIREETEIRVVVMAVV